MQCYSYDGVLCSQAFSEYEIAQETVESSQEECEASLRNLLSKVSHHRSPKRLAFCGIEGSDSESYIVCIIVASPRLSLYWK